MNVLVTGSSGRIGKRLVQKLKQESDLQVFTLTRKTVAREPARTSDLTDPQDLMRACKGISTVIHLAGLTHSHSKTAYYATNLQGTRNLLRACEINRVKRFIFISSQSASPHGGAYAHSKLLAEKALSHSPIDWIILRLSEVYGGGAGDTISELIHRIKRNRIVPLPGFRNTYLQPVFVDDVVNSLIKALESDIRNRTFLLAGPQTFSYREMVQTVSQTFNKKVLLLPIPLLVIRMIILLQRFIRMPSLTQDQIQRLMVPKPRNIEAAQKDLEFSPLAFRQYLKTLSSRP